MDATKRGLKEAVLYMWYGQEREYVAAQQQCGELITALKAEFPADLRYLIDNLCVAFYVAGRLQED